MSNKSLVEILAAADAAIALEEVLLEREEYIETLEMCSPQRIDAVAEEVRGLEIKVDQLQGALAWLPASISSHHSPRRLPTQSSPPSEV
ncbi:hypothetical protein C8J57DRAFT_1528377 [Mycena rebaudengoi]|nr:hypothetical protein C8J57DRAFT_1528377 [Mycena rebaudengoi]